ncbi:sigma-70 family RNA polymerase sigma factor [Candidatus Peribacteria bacterium]|nr:sigma-70 family RNA polymerase sigma factor [Candidatus Peribacteria bacterium]
MSNASSHEITDNFTDSSHAVFDESVMQELYVSMQTELQRQFSWNPDLAEDALQQAWVKILRRRESLTAEQINLPYFMTIARGEALRLWAEKKRRDETYICVGSPEQAFDYRTPSPHQSAVQTESHGLFTSYLRQMGPMDEEIVRLRILDLMQYSAMHERMKMSQSALHGVCQRAMADLFELLEIPQS